VGQFQALLSLYPQNQLVHTAGKIRQGYRWICGLGYDDSEGRHHGFNALECVEETADQVRHFAWLTCLPVDATNVMAIANQGGRARWKMENEGFNRQKNSDLNLEHVYSTDPDKWKAYYYLLQIAFILTQLVERGSLLRRLAAECGRTVHQLFGSLQNIARRLLEVCAFASGQLPGSIMTKPHASTSAWTAVDHSGWMLAVGLLTWEKPTTVRPEQSPCAPLRCPPPAERGATRAKKRIPYSCG